MPFTSISKSEIKSVKKWIMEIIDKIPISNQEKRALISKSFTHFEYLCYNEMKYGLTISENNLKLLAFTVLSLIVDHKHIEKKIAADFDHYDFHSLRKFLISLNFEKEIKHESAYDTLYKLFNNITAISETEKIISLRLLDLFHTDYFTILMHKQKIACACLCVIRLIGLHDYHRAWSEKFISATNFDIHDFINEFDLVFVLLSLV